MFLARPLARLRNHRKVPVLAQEIARQSRERVWQRAGSRATSMSPSEARGYIRAWAAEPVDHELDRLLGSREDLRGWARDPLRAEAISAVVRLVSQQLVDSRSQYVNYRRAA